MRNDKETMLWQRKVLAIYGFLLPLLAPLFGFLAYDLNGPTFWYSISATFYATSNILMIGPTGSGKTLLAHIKVMILVIVLHVNSLLVWLQVYYYSHVNAQLLEKLQVY